MADLVVYPRKLLKQFILLYKDLPCLWDRNCIAYKHKHKRHAAISKLTELVQQHDPAATRVHVLRKIESLRACVRREYKRVQDSRKKARTPDEIYTPHLWYYDLFSFVFQDDQNNYKVKPGSPEQEQEQVVAESEEEGSEPAPEDDTFIDPSIENYTPEYNVNSNMIEVSEGSSMQYSKRYPNFEDEKSKRHCTEIEDEYDAIGINVAAKLRGLPPNMRILAEKLINDVLYQAQMNGLNSATVISTPDPFKQDM